MIVTVTLTSQPITPAILVRCGWVFAFHTWPSIQHPPHLTSSDSSHSFYMKYTSSPYTVSVRWFQVSGLCNRSYKIWHKQPCTICQHCWHYVVWDLQLHFLSNCMSVCIQSHRPLLNLNEIHCVSSHLDLGNQSECKISRVKTWKQTMMICHFNYFHSRLLEHCTWPHSLSWWFHN